MKFFVLLLFLNVIFAIYNVFSPPDTMKLQDYDDLIVLNNLALTTQQKMRWDQVNAESESTSKPTRCIRIEGLELGDTLEIVESRLKSLEVAPQRLVESVLLKTEYQVLYGPFDTELKAREQLQSLSFANIESYLITTGEYQNALSLGVFSSDDNARKKLSEVSDKGINARVVEKQHRGDQVVLFITAQRSTLVNDATLSAMLSSFEGSRFYRYGC